MKRKLYFCWIGVLILGFGSAICRIAQVGLDPCTSMNASIAQAIHSTLGVTMMTFQIIVLLLVFILNRSYIGWGTFINAICLGYFIDAFTAIFSFVFSIPEVPGIAMKIPCMIVGIALITLGISVYFTGSLGLSPYDAIGKIFSERTPIPYPVCRITTDMICVVIGLFLQGPIGPGTVVTAFFTGPMIEFWNRKVSQPLFDRKKICL